MKRHQYQHGVIGCAVFIAGLVSALDLHAQCYSLQILYAFVTPGPSEPASGVLRTAGGDLYGTTPEGNSVADENGSGTVYHIATNGVLEVLAVADGTYGYYPSAGLVEGQDGNFYGSYPVGSGGTYSSIFSISPTGDFAIFFDFNSPGTNGYEPGPLLLATDGNFYGTTEYGGSGYNTYNDTTNGGTVFKLTSAGQFTLLNSFTGTNGFRPAGRLMQAKNGNIYGVTTDGGMYGAGSIFCVYSNGGFQSLFSFDGSNGSTPVTGLVEGEDGWLYGMTENDESSDGEGEIYKVNTNGELATVASFNGLNGREPSGSLVRSDDGVLYGVTQLGGDYDGGTAFKLTTNGLINVIASFDDATGRWPTELTKGSDGNFYGTTAVLGGGFAEGTVFRLAQTPSICSTAVSNGAVHLQWNAFQGGVYQVECKTCLSDTNWTVLSNRITTATNSASYWDSPVPAKSRFYRINLLPW